MSMILNAFLKCALKTPRPPVLGGLILYQIQSLPCPELIAGGRGFRVSCTSLTVTLAKCFNTSRLIACACMLTFIYNVLYSTSIFIPWKVVDSSRGLRWNCTDLYENLAAFEKQQMYHEPLALPLEASKKLSSITAATARAIRFFNEMKLALSRFSPPRSTNFI